MNDHLDAKGKVRRAVTAVGGAAVSEVLGNALTSSSPAAQAAEPAHEAAAAEASTREWVPDTESSSVSRGEDGSVEAKTSTVWHPETRGGGTETLPEDLPTIEEFEQIDVREDEFGNFIIDATERYVVHNHGHDETYVDHQHLVVPGDGTPGDTDLDVVEHADVIVHENPDGSIWVEHSGSITVETHPDAPGHGDIEVWQEESVVLDEAPTGPPGIEVGISEDEQAYAEDPFGEPAGATIHQTESVTEKGRTVTTTVTSPAPSLPAPPSTASVAFSRPPSTVDTAPVAQPLLAETKLVASATLADPPVTKHVEPKETFAPAHSEKHSFATDPPAEKHDPGELTGPKPVPEEHQPGEMSGSKPVPDEHHPDVPTVEEPVHENPPVQEVPRVEDVGVHEQQTPVEEPHPVPEMPGHEPFHQAHADGGG